MNKDGQVSRLWLISRVLRNIKALNNNNKRQNNPLNGDIKQAMCELENIRNFFDLAEEPELIDYAIFTEKAAMMRLSYLLKKAKKNEEMLSSSNGL